jgi:holliday junction DNA helicase RuvA
MITYVSGRLVQKKPTEAVVDVHGLGYHVLIPTSTYSTLPPEGEPVMLFTYHYVREDAALLYGFATKPERQLFQVMLSVAGVGPKLALAALSAMRPSELRDHVLSGDVRLLTGIPGVGRKTAERMVVELKDRLVAVDLDDAAAPLSGGTDQRAAARADALAALEQLGLSRAAGEKSLRSVLRNHPAIQSADELVRLALRES